MMESPVKATRYRVHPLLLGEAEVGRPLDVSSGALRRSQAG
jgi:hypothetical protein